MEITRRQFTVGAGAAGALALSNGQLGFARPLQGTQNMQNSSKCKSVLAATERA